MKFGNVTIIFWGFWDFGFKKGVYPRKDYIIYEWYQIGFMKIIVFRRKNDRTRK